MLYSDLQRRERGADGFVRLDDEERAQLFAEQESNGRYKSIRMSLPVDYLGKELSMTTYFLGNWDGMQPEYPFLGSDDSFAAELVTASVTSMVMIVLAAILALLLAVIFLLDIANGRADVGTLLLCLYFVLLFLEQAYGSSPGYYSILSERVDLSFLKGLYPALLYLYLSFRLPKRWKYPLCAGTLIWVLYEGTRILLNIRNGLPASEGQSGAGALFLFFAVVFALGAVHFRRARGSREREPFGLWMRRRCCGGSLHPG